MNGLTQAAVSLLYALPLALAAALLAARPRYPVRWLVGVLVALPLFYIGHYLLITQIQGWPSQAPLPPRFELLAFDIAEPDPRRSAQGHILIWAKPDGETQPRSYKLGYHKQLHESLISAADRQAQGRTQIGTHTARSVAATGAEAAPGDAGTIRFDDGHTTPLPAKESTDG